MRSLVSGFVLLGLLAAGCNKDKTPPAPAPVQPTSEAPAKVEAPPAAASSAPEAPATTDGGASDAGAESPDASTPAPTAQLPAPRWETLPGWLGYTTIKPGAKPSKPEDFWAPENEKAQVVLFSEAWKDVPAGARVKLVSPTGTVQEGTYLGTSTEHYGCEENTATFAAFSTPTPLPEGPIWVLPPDAKDVQAVPVRDVPLSEVPAELLKGVGVSRPKEKDVRAFEAGGLTFVLAKKGRTKGVMKVFRDGKPTGVKEDLGKGEMEGSDNSPLDLYSPNEVGMPRPFAAFRFGADGPLAVVLGSRSYEGQNFWLATRQGDTVKMDRGEGEYLYFCAF